MPSDWSLGVRLSLHVTGTLTPSALIRSHEYPGVILFLCLMLDLYLAQCQSQNFVHTVSKASPSGCPTPQKKGCEQPCKEEWKSYILQGASERGKWSSLVKRESLFMFLNECIAGYTTAS